MNMNMTETKARNAGYKLRRGGFFGTNDNRADRWYILEIDEAADLRGPGFKTKKEALQFLKYWIKEDILVLYYDHGLSVEEVAGKVGLKLGDVDVLLNTTVAPE